MPSVDIPAKQYHENFNMFCHFDAVNVQCQNITFQNVGAQICGALFGRTPQTLINPGLCNSLIPRIVLVISACTAEGRSAAAMYSCKYIEVSATIDLHIDALFAGVVRQIRSLRRQRDSGSHQRRHQQHALRHKRNYEVHITYV